jgi:hypothetical protein
MTTAWDNGISTFGPSFSDFLVLVLLVLVRLLRLVRHVPFVLVRWFSSSFLVWVVVWRRIRLCSTSPSRPSTGQSGPLRYLPGESNLSRTTSTQDHVELEIVFDRMNRFVPRMDVFDDNIASRTKKRTSGNGTRISYTARRS